MTRTIHFGNPTNKHREAYTRVLIGSIQLSTLIFPDNVNTSSIDTMARAPLWEVGYDYPHGTGHGIGTFRNVHECNIHTYMPPSSIHILICITLSFNF